MLKENEQEVNSNNTDGWTTYKKMNEIQLDWVTMKGKNRALQPTGRWHKMMILI